MVWPPTLLGIPRFWAQLLLKPVFIYHLTGWTDGSVSSCQAWVASPRCSPPARHPALQRWCSGLPPCRMPAGWRRRGRGLWQARSSDRWWSSRTGCEGAPLGISTLCRYPSLSGGTVGRPGGRKETSKICHVCIWRGIKIRNITWTRRSPRKKCRWVGLVGPKLLLIAVFMTYLTNILVLKVHFFVPSPKSPKIFGMGESHRTGRRFKGEVNPFWHAGPHHSSEWALFNGTCLVFEKIDLKVTMWSKIRPMHLKTVPPTAVIRLNLFRRQQFQINWCSNSAFLKNQASYT